MKRQLLFLAACASVLTTKAQLSLSNGDNVLEVTGLLSAFYNQRFLKPDETNNKKDRFDLRDAQVQLEGRYRNTFEYELQFDIADMSAGGGTVDPENPGLMDANVTWKGLRYLSVTFGYGKVPYGRSTQVPTRYSPYWERPEITHGDLFSDRDIGLTLGSVFCKQRAQVQAGVYTGLGDASLLGDNDPSGDPEYIGRVGMAWPSRYRMRDIDDRITPVPMVVVGANARYMDKSQPLGASLPPLVGGTYGLEVIDGSRSAVGCDVSAQYMGFSAQFEVHRLRYDPRSPNSSLFDGTTPDESGGYFLAGGYYGQLSWFSRKWKTILSGRFEEVNLSDLVPGDMQRVSGAVAYQIHGFDAIIKAQYWHNIKEETTLDPLKWTDQVRIGFQYAFN